MPETGSNLRIGKTDRRSSDGFGPVMLHLVYWIIPSVCLLGLALIYFLDPLEMSKIIAPELNREFGLIEHLQLLLILGIVYLTIRQFRSASTSFERAFFLFASIFSVFVFLEEVDYGIHYYELLQTNTIVENSTGVFEDKPRNIHNQGEMRTYIMWFVYLGLVLVLGFSRFIKDRIAPENPYVQWFVPGSLFLGLSLIAMFLLNEVVRYLDKHVKDPSIVSLNGNTIEFQETFIYYIALIYIFELTRKPFRRSPVLER